MSIESFLEGLRQGWGNKFSHAIREVGFESLVDAADLTEDEVRNILKASLETAGALPLHILKICKGIVKAACDPTHNSEVREFVQAASLPMLPQDVGIDVGEDVSRLITPNAATTTDEDAYHVPDKPSHGNNMPRHFGSWTDVTVAVHTEALQQNKEVHTTASQNPNNFCRNPYPSLVTPAGTAQYPWVLRQARYCGYCRWVLWGTVGTAGTVQYPQYPLVLQGTVGTVGTARGESDSWVLRQYQWVCTAGYCGYCTDSK